MSNLLPLHIDKDTGRIIARPAVTGPSSSGALGFVYTQTTPTTVWTINHGGNTKLLIHRIFDSTFEEIIPDGFRIIDNNNVEVRFAAPMTGVVHLVYFTQV